jgi:hypothetical protein
VLIGTVVIIGIVALLAVRRIPWLRRMEDPAQGRDAAVA